MARNNEHTNMVTVLQVLEPEETLKGKSFCITGHLGRPRAEIEDLIAKAGGMVDKDVKSDTSFLVTNEDWTASTVGKKGSSKYQKAQRYRVKIISEKTFFEMISRTSGN